MATSAAEGRSLVEDSYESGRDAARCALDDLPEGRADLALVFATTGHDQGELLRGVRSVLGQTRVVGCSGEGVITRGESLECDHATAVMAIRSDALAFEPFLLRAYSEDPAGRGRELAELISDRADDDGIGLFVFPDGLTGNCTRFLQELQDRLPVPLVVAGGTSADAMVFRQTFQYGDDTVASDAISAVLVRGEGEAEVAVSHGCRPIGLEREVTRGDSGWIYEIDGRPAWSVFKEYLDGDPDDLNGEGIVHLCIGEPLEADRAEGYAPYVIRTPLRLEKDNGALFFPGGGLNTGQRIRLTRRDPQQIKQSARACAERILSRQGGRRPALVLQFDCAGRGRVLFGSRATQEIVEPLQQTLGPETPWIGFHTYGEIAPIGDRLFYHNYTVALCALYDAD